MKTLIIVNPISGDGQAWQASPHLVKTVLQELEHAEVCLTEYHNHAVQLTQEAIQNGYERLVAIGGDGLNHQVINGFFEKGVLLNPKVQFGILPIKTGSDFCKTLGIPLHWPTALQILKQGQVRQGDLGSLKCVGLRGEEIQRYFINMSSFGLNGLANQYVARQARFLGKTLSYVMGAARALTEYRALPISLVADGELWYEGKCFFASVGNGQYSNGGMKITPHASIDDGWLDGVIVGDLSLWEHMTRAPLVYTGKHVEYEHILERRLRRLTATPIYHDDIFLEADGEPLGKLPATFEVVRGAIPYLVPRTETGEIASPT